MNDTLTVFRKEILELFGNRHSSRGPLVQAGIMLALAGVLLPSAGAAAWVLSPSTPLLFFMLPSALAAGVAADSFAGERERKTLETLLATPLPDHAIFLGKIGAAVGFAVAVGLLTLGLATVTINVVGWHGPLFLPESEVVIGALGSALGASITTAAVAVGISMRVAVARSAQQMASLLGLVLVGMVAFTVNQLHMPLTWALVLRIDLVACAIGVVALRALARMFRRERFFEVR